MQTDIGVPGVTGAEQIGQGAFGRVYRAEQTELDRIVAVKVLANVDLDEETRIRFGREAKAIGRMSGHPNIVNVYAQGVTTDDMPYLIMEYCAKGSLGDRLKNHKPLSWQEATAIMLPIAGALQTAHHAGILHRDIKPANILVDSYDTPKLADFGIARLGTDVSVTATGMLTGSPAHIAPELVAGTPPSPASDIYSLGSTLFTLITGRAPFHRETDTSILSLLQRISSESPPHLGQWGVPAPVADLVAATLAKDPNQRPPTCRDFAEALMGARSSLGLAPGAYRADPAQRTGGQPAPDLNATVLPSRPVPMSPVAATYPSAAFGMAGPIPGTPHAGAITAVGDDASRNRQRMMLIMLCWVIVAICLLIITGILVGRADQVASAAAAYILGD
jgi:serine/threonine protein kinase